MTASNNYPEGAPTTLAELASLPESAVGVLIGMQRVQPTKFKKTKRVGEEVCDARYAKELTRTALSRVSGVDAKLIGWLEQGLVPDTFAYELLTSLAPALEVVPQQLWEDEIVQPRATVGVRVVGMLSRARESLQVQLNQAWELTMLGSYGPSLAYQVNHGVTTTTGDAQIGDSRIDQDQIHVELGSKLAGHLVTLSDPSDVDNIFAETLLDSEGVGDLPLPGNQEGRDLALIIWDEDESSKDEIDQE
ncbi:MAG: hypothetical protein ACYDHP_09635 [Ferrimicrobium sp.]